ncbi:MAG: SDR family oxidoreductase [Chloroflexi bacterium]|nr:SDR family oxidoreductase [Chloroflexota bacterium]
MDLKGKVALISGALGGVGSAIARKMAQEGADLALTARRPGDLEDFCRELQSLGHQVLALPADGTQRDQVVSVVDKTAAHFGHIDILVNAMSGDIMERFHEGKEENWDRMMAVNVYGFLYFQHAALQHMIPANKGRIINLVSDSAKIGATMEAVQSLTKGGMVAFGKSLAREVARYSITVNTVCVGPTRTPGFIEGMEKSNSPGYQAFMRLQPMHRAAEPAEVAAVVAFLATDDASFVTGQAISASGGLTMC